MVSVALEKLRLEIPSRAKPLQKRTQELIDWLARISDDVHRMAYSLHPAVLENLGLPAALETECRHFAQSEGIQVDFEQHNQGPSLPEPVSLCLYRVAQETLRNIARHSGARKAVVSLTVAPDQVVSASGITEQALFSTISERLAGSAWLAWKNGSIR